MRVIETEEFGCVVLIVALALGVAIARLIWLVPEAWL